MDFNAINFPFLKIHAKSLSKIINSAVKEGIKKEVAKMDKSCVLDISHISNNKVDISAHSSKHDNTNDKGTH